MRLVSNLHLKHRKSKRYTRTGAIEIAKADRDCRIFGCFTLIKNTLTGWYDYVPGSANVLLSSDVPQADYHIRHGRWECTRRGS